MSIISMVIKTKGVIKEIRELSPTVNHFVFELEDNFDFVAGQFVNLSFKEEDKLYRKPYSIASEPKTGREIELCIKLVENGTLTPKLWKKEVGFEAEIMGPLGLFTCEKSQKDSMIFIFR